jgi:hypothetical protein
MGGDAQLMLIQRGALAEKSRRARFFDSARRLTPLRMTVNQASEPLGMLIDDHAPARRLFIRSRKSVSLWIIDN